MQVIFEKRLGIAQLCLLLTVLVFMGLTRGAPSVGHSRVGISRPMREWGVRSLSFGSHTEGGWNPLRLRSRSPAAQRAGAKHEQVTGVYSHSFVELRFKLSKDRTCRPCCHHWLFKGGLLLQFRSVFVTPPGHPSRQPRLRALCTSICTVRLPHGHR